MDKSQKFNEVKETITRFGKSFTSGFISSSIAKYVGHPLDTIKVRIQVSGDQMKLHHHFSNIFHKEGIRGFYKGAISPVLGTAPVIASLFAINDFSKRKLKDAPMPKFVREALPG
mmetsp:Transcript_21183/g.18798  ORF Transcript_21183/g.18798 Transcript_21183/m.18798 type:complete len:115 (+) Transcript_21183:3-347(+)